MAALEPRRAAWEKQLLARYDAGELTWQFQRPQRAQSQNGAVLKIYNDETLDYTSYDGASLSTFRAPGNGLVIAASS